MTGWRKLAVIAGGGELPAQIIRACRERSAACHVIRIAGFADPVLGGDECGFGEAGKILRILKDQNCDAAVFAGVVRRPDFAALKADWRGAAMLPKILAAAAKGDGALLQVVVDTVESEGVKVIGAEEALGSLKAPAGALGAVAPDESNLRDIAKAAALIDALGPFDVGQAAVVALGLTLAVEAAEGTDAMLERCAGLPLGVRGGGKSGVLVKKPKPGQELRIDLPVIGPQTIRNIAAAGLNGVAYEAERALIIDRDSMVWLADEAGLFVYGFTQQDLRAADAF